MPTHRPLPQPEPPIGPIAGIVRGIIERIGEIARAIGAYEAFILLMTFAGIGGAIKSEEPWSIVCLVMLGTIASLVSRWPKQQE